MCTQAPRRAHPRVSPQAQGQRRHPDNDLTISNCSRCGCPPDAHAILHHEHEKELGNDAFALGNWDAALAHYSKALDLHRTSAVLWSNRAACYLAKGW